MRGVVLFSTSVALAVPAIMWPPRPVRAETLDTLPCAVQVVDAARLAEAIS
ncbi:hypothetical protein [Alteraurantiacibacter palmitatis]|uniref:Uncharacterized protein n=1 Tax=Alteraurantiacibacter palmitatis TaxID=2054628 RepID=A0ABV7E881_9SPHN